MTTITIRAITKNMTDMIRIEVDQINITKEEGMTHLGSRITTSSIELTTLGTPRIANSSIPSKRQPIMRQFFKNRKYWKRKRWWECQA